MDWRRGPLHDLVRREKPRNLYLLQRRKGIIVMSRIGKKLIVLPKEVKVTYDNGALTVKGPKGTLTRTLHDSVDLEVTSTEIKVILREDKQSNWRYSGFGTNFGVKSGYRGEYWFYQDSRHHRHRL